MRHEKKEKTPFMSLRHFLFHNFLLKLLAFVLAVVIYFTLRENLPQINTSAPAEAKPAGTAPAKQPEAVQARKASPKKQSRQMLRKTDTAEAAQSATNAADHAKAARK